MRGRLVTGTTPMRGSKVPARKVPRPIRGPPAGFRGGGEPGTVPATASSPHSPPTSHGGERGRSVCLAQVLVGLVGDGLDLERRVVDREVLAGAFAELVQDPADTDRLERLVGHRHV